MKPNYPFNLLDDCHIKYDQNAKWEVFEMDARELLSYQRFDLFANLFYIRAYTNKGGIDTAKAVYRARTAAITGYKLSEPGNDNKNNFEDFVKTFNSLIETFRIKGFDPECSIVPINENNILIDGAHRVCCAAWGGAKGHSSKTSSEFQQATNRAIFFLRPQTMRSE